MLSNTTFGLRAFVLRVAALLTLVVCLCVGRAALFADEPVDGQTPSATVEETNTTAQDALEPELAPANASEPDETATVDPQEYKLAADPEPEGFNFPRLLSVFYGPSPDEVEGDARYGYDHTVVGEESTFVVVCRLLYDQRMRNPWAFWGFWALLVALIACPYLHRRARRNASGHSDAQDSSDVE